MITFLNLLAEAAGFGRARPMAVQFIAKADAQSRSHNEGCCQFRKSQTPAPGQ